MSLRADISKVKMELKLSDKDFNEVGKANWKNILKKIGDKYLQKATPIQDFHLGWTFFKGETYSLQLQEEFESISKCLQQMINIEDEFWFIVDETETRSKQWLYRGNGKAIIKVIEELYHFEYYLLPLDFSWILAENHHGYLIKSMGK